MCMNHGEYTRDKWVNLYLNVTGNIVSTAVRCSSPSTEGSVSLS